MSEEWIFVVDTDKYAGNFERDMCAFVTGMVGECMVGAEEARLYYEQTGLVEKDFDWSGTSVEYCAEDLNNPFAVCVANRNDEHGCGRPTSLWPTPGWFNHGMGGHFKDGQEEEALADYKEKCLEYAKKKVHENDQVAHEARWKENAEKPLNKCYANQSVAIFFDKKPSDELCNLMINRAKAYVQEYCPTRENEWDRHEIEIFGFRLLVEKTVQEEENSWEA
jgi:hypothetical protein